MKGSEALLFGYTYITMCNYSLCYLVGHALRKEIVMEKKITRTIKMYVYNVKAINDKDEVINLTLETAHQKPKAVAEDLKSRIPVGSIIVSHSLKETKEVTYGMTLVDFIAHAKAMTTEDETAIKVSKPITEDKKGG